MITDLTSRENGEEIILGKSLGMIIVPYCRVYQLSCVLIRCNEATDAQELVAIEKIIQLSGISSSYLSKPSIHFKILTRELVTDCNWYSILV